MCIVQILCIQVRYTDCKKGFIFLNEFLLVISLFCLLAEFQGRSRGGRETDIIYGWAIKWDIRRVFVSVANYNPLGAVMTPHK